MEYQNYLKFIRNKYYMCYDRIIQRAVRENRVYDSCIYEWHHALPDCLGGRETVPLTFKEHYICHWLLTKFTQDHDRYKMIVAMSFFYYNKPNKNAKRPLNAQKSRAYASFKHQFCQALQGRVQWTLSDIHIFKNMDTGEIFEGTRHEFYIHNNETLSHMEIYNLIVNGCNGTKRWHSKRWGVWNAELKMFSCDIPKRKNPTMSRRITCAGCGKTTSPGNIARWHKNCNVS